MPSSRLATILLIAQTFSTSSMCGLIWLIQLVHYPLFLRADPATFAAFEADHARRITWVVAPLMLVELATAAALLLPRLRPASVSSAEALFGLALVGVLWLSTLLLQIPLHNHLHLGFDRAAIQRLVATNWLRTAAWTARSALLCVWLNRLLR